MSRQRFGRLLGLTLAAWLFTAPVQSAPAIKPKDKARAVEGVPAEPVEGEPVQLAAHRLRSSNNLKQLALAFHNYTDTNGAFPTDILDKDGKPLLSWRVRLLPYVEQDNLYKQIKLDEAWDGPTNKALLESMPKLFASPRVTVKAAGHTVYQGFAGSGSLFERGIKPLTFRDILDGSSNTIFVMEAGTAVPWTKPVDMPFDPKADLPDLGKAYTGKPLAALLDGSVRLLDVTKISAKTLKAAVTRDGGETLGGDW